VIALAVAGIGAWAAFELDRIVGVAVVSALLFGLYQLVRSYSILERCRRSADDWLRTSVGGVVPPAYAWRAAQLTSPHERRMLARTIRRVAETSRRRPVGTIRPRLGAARGRNVSLEVLATRLERVGEPVTPAGILRVTELIATGDGPLWGASEEALGDEIASTLAVLSPPGA
jgi:hypothetical protein